MPDDFVLVSFLAGILVLVSLIVNRYFRGDLMVRFFLSLFFTLFLNDATSS
jgi:hypothetical protein